jgi:hypothetical protein
MKIFIGSSGERSKKIAQLLYERRPIVVQNIKPYMSTEIDKGARYDPEGRLVYAGRVGTGIDHAELERLVAPPAAARRAQHATGRIASTL